MDLSLDAINKNLTIEQDPMMLPVICEDCGEHFSLGGVRNTMMVHKRKFIVKGQTIYLSYYDCPKCGRRHFVQIDNDQTLLALKECTRLFQRLATLRANEKQAPKSQSARFKKTRQHLAHSRNNLMKEFTDSLLYDEHTDSYFTLTFSV